MHPQVPRRFNDLSKALPPSRYDITPLPSPSTKASTNPSANLAAATAEAADVSPAEHAPGRQAANPVAVPMRPASLECPETVDAYKAAYKGYLDRLGTAAVHGLAQQARTHVWT